MHFDYTDKVKAMRQRVRAFMDEHILPAEPLFEAEMKAFRAAGNPWQEPQVMEALKHKARAAGLWNLFLPESPLGAGLSNLEYAPLAEIMGRVLWASEVFNCSAPDTGNMEILDLFATPQQRVQWLRPLLEGEIRSGFAMTEPAVASSDATNIEACIDREGDQYVINGRKWWTSGADPVAVISTESPALAGGREPSSRQSVPTISTSPGRMLWKALTSAQSVAASRTRSASAASSAIRGLRAGWGAFMVLEAPLRPLGPTQWRSNVGFGVVVETVPIVDQPGRHRIGVVQIQPRAPGVLGQSIGQWQGDGRHGGVVRVPDRLGGGFAPDLDLGQVAVA